jgi:U3 small nucleolar RNA-associated protein 19
LRSHLIRFTQLFETEVIRKIKREPALGMESSLKVFPEEKAQNTEEDSMAIDTTAQRDVVAELWTFA